MRPPTTQTKINPESKKHSPEPQNKQPAHFVFDEITEISQQQLNKNIEGAFPCFDDDIDEHFDGTRAGTVIIKNLKYQNNFRLQIGNPHQANLKETLNELNDVGLVCEALEKQTSHFGNQNIEKKFNIYLEGLKALLQTVPLT